MATFIDVTLLEGFQSLFIFLLVWAIVYGILSYTKPFGDNNKVGLYSFIALFIALLTLFSRPVLDVIAVIAPWYVAAIMFVIFLLMIILALGYNTEDVHKTLTGPEWSKIIVTWVIVISVIILLGGLGQVFFTEQTAQPVEEVTAPIVPGGNVGEIGQDAFFATLFHPRVLGMIVVLIVGFLAIVLLARGGAK